MNNLFEKELVIASIRQSFVKLDPRQMKENPIMFTVEICTAVMLPMTIYSAFSSKQGSFAYNAQILPILFATLSFVNFAEAIVEARGKAQTDSLCKTHEETPAKLYVNGNIKTVSSSSLEKGDEPAYDTGDVIPTDGEVVEGPASIGKSAITGESAPVICGAGDDRSSVIGDAKVPSDRIRVVVTTQPGEGFLDKTIAPAEDASRQKTLNEIVFTVLLVVFTLAFLIVYVALKSFVNYTGTVTATASLLSLSVCPILTTTGGLFSTIGITGMDRTLHVSVITRNGKAVETADDVDTLSFDKTGTITIDNCKVIAFYPAEKVGKAESEQAYLLSSTAGDTPEGESIIELGQDDGFRTRALHTESVHMTKFIAETKSSDIVLEDNTEIRKGAFETMRHITEDADYTSPEHISCPVTTITGNGDTPLAVTANKKVVGVIEPQDIIEQGIRERLKCLHEMGVRIVMVTDDNPLTARYIAEKAEVDDFIAEAKPEDKTNYVKAEQKNSKLITMMGDGTNGAPALAQADMDVVMNSGTQAVKEASNMINLDDSPTKPIEAVEIGKQLLMTCGTLATFSIANDVAKYSAIVPALLMVSILELAALDVMNLHSPESAILPAVIYNAIIILLLIPLALHSVRYKPIGANASLRRNLLIFGVGSIIAPLVGIKLIDLIVGLFS